MNVPSESAEASATVGVLESTTITKNSIKTTLPHIKRLREFQS